MPAALEALIDDIDTHYGDVYGDLYNAGVNIRSAGIYLQAENVIDAGTKLALAGSYTKNAAVALAKYTNSAGDSTIDALQYINDYVPWTPSEVTMASILNVMLGATPMELEYFIGLVDAYRQSLWNKPFNSEFFAALARGFQEWP